MTSRTAQRKRSAPSQARKGKQNGKARGKRANRRRVSPGVLAIGAVIAIVAIMAVAAGTGLIGGSSAPEPADAAASARVIEDVTSVPASALDAVGAAGASGVPIALPPSTPAYTVDGKPAVLYVGAEYCPYCAAERWALVVALSRFGGFSGLGLTTSGAEDVYPSTPTLSFHGSSYRSELISFAGVETATNELNAAGTAYEPLDMLSPEQQRLFQTFNAPPYTSSAGSIPFLLIGDRYASTGASVQPDILQGKTWDEIAAALRDPASPVAQQVLASANVITAAICELTGGEPANVCASPGVRQGAGALAGS